MLMALALCFVLGVPPQQPDKMVRPTCCEQMNVKRGLWTREEDAKIVAYVSKHGTGNWTAAPKKAGLRRCGKSCRLRWSNYLRPDLHHDSFTLQEEELIVKLHATIGSRWSIIAQQLPGRTDNDVKNHWNTKLRKKLSEMGIDPVTHKPFSQILADYGNIGGFSKSGTRIGSLGRDLKNAFISKPEPCASSRNGLSNINGHLIPTMVPPKFETTTTQECFLNNNNVNIYGGNNDHSLDLLDQLQAIKLVTEASRSCNNYNTLSPNLLHECSVLSSPSSSSSSSTCSTAAQENFLPSFSWRDFLLEDEFLPTEDHPPHEDDDMAELSSRGTTSQTPNASKQQDETRCEVAARNHIEVEGIHVGVSLSNNGIQVQYSPSEKSFVEAILDREKEMLLDFPNLLEEPFYGY